MKERARSQELDGKPEDAKLLQDSFAAGGWDAFLRESVRQGAAVGSVASLGAVGEVDKESTIKKLDDKAARGDFWLCSYQN